MSLSEFKAALGVNDASCDKPDVEIADYSRLPEKPVISILMVTYNHARFIKQALDSALMQELPVPFEICIGEDGSTDGTRAVCLDYVARYPERIRLFLRDRANPRRKEFSVPFMYNAAETYRACRGKYIALLEGDDYWTSPNKLRLQFEVMEADPDCSVCAHYMTAFCDAMPCSIWSLPQSHLQNFNLAYLLEECYFLGTCSLFLRRGEPIPEAISRRATAGDSLFIFHHLLSGRGIVVPQHFGMYRVHSSGASRGGAGYDVFRANLTQWKMLAELAPTNLRGAARRGYCKLLSGYVSDFRQNNQFALAIQTWAALLKELVRTRCASLSEGLVWCAAATLGLLSPFCARIFDKVFRVWRLRSSK